MRHRITIRRILSCFVLAGLVSTHPALAATLTFLSDVSEPTLTNRFNVILVSPDGAHVYAGSSPPTGPSQAASIAVFSRNPGDGSLSFVEVEVNGGVGSLQDLGRIEEMAMSPDGTSLYAAAAITGEAFVVMSRNPSTGELDFVESHVHTVGDVGPSAIVVSPDGSHVYTAATSTGISIWERNPSTGALTLLDQIDSPSSFTPRTIAISADGEHVYAGDSSSDPSYEIRVFARDPSTGHLTKTQVLSPRMPAATNTSLQRETVTALLLSPDDAHLYAGVSNLLTETAQDVAQFSRDSSGLLSYVDHLPVTFLLVPHACARTDAFEGALDFAWDAVGTRLFASAREEGVSILKRDPATGVLGILELQPATGPGTQLSLAVSPDGAHAYMGTLERTVEIYSIGASPPDVLPLSCRLPGRSLKVKSSGAGGAKRSARVIAHEPSLSTAFPGTENDPGCNGDPPGTVRATIRFFSDSSGQDTGSIALPCQNWTRLGDPDDPLRGYRYFDPVRADGPCREVELKGTKLLQASCDNRGSSPFPYALAGVDEGMIHVLLELASIRYCAAFDDHNGQDGSDGRRFVGKNSPPPTDCP